MKKLKIDYLGNDMFADIECECPSPLFIGSDIEHIMKDKIKFTGYNDSHFFDEVNKEPKHFECKGCGMNFDYRWTREYVEVTNLIKAQQ